MNYIIVPMYPSITGPQPQLALPAILLREGWRENGKAS